MRFWWFYSMSSSLKMGNAPKIAIIGAGAGGCFSAIQVFDALAGRCSVEIFEKSKEPLSKLRISGGGRCNVTHNLFDPEALSLKYPRGNKELKYAFQTFQPKDTIEWFRQRGIRLKVEPDGRMFPESDSSETIINCFLAELQKRKIPIHFSKSLVGLYKEDSIFRVLWEGGDSSYFDRIIFATGSNRKIWSLLEILGHKIVPPVPSLFTFGVSDSDIINLSGITVQNVHIKISPKGKPQVGPLLITHWGFSGPAALKLSAYEARTFYDLDYKTKITINWLGDKSTPDVENFLLTNKDQSPNIRLSNLNFSLPSRLWDWILQNQLVSGQKRLSELSNHQIRNLALKLTASEFLMTSKSIYKEEFVTAGGVSRKDINFSKMESKIIPGIFFTGEVIDIDGVTGGFNFQNAWTTGTLAAQGLKISLNI